MHNKDRGCPIGSHNHSSSLVGEIVSHLPHAIFSVAFCLTILSFFSAFQLSINDIGVLKRVSSVLFHSFHFLHILFSVTGTMITFYRFSTRIVRGIFVGIFSALVFCTLSDAVMPYLAGKILYVDMKFHLCLFHELQNVIPFLIAGVISGVVIAKSHKSNILFYSKVSHFVHILISSFASMFYLVAHGMPNWYSQIGIIFLFLIVAVVIPCILSDIVTPMTFARADKKNERNKIKEYKENI